MSQVNVWALHDPYAVIGEEKPVKSGDPQDAQTLDGLSGVALCTDTL